jgi:hypothetical protein
MPGRRCMGETEFKPARTARLFQIPQGCDQRIHFFAGVVEGECSANGALLAKAAQNWLRAMMPAAHRDSLAVEIVANFFAAKTFDHKGKYAGFFFCRTDDGEAGNALQGGRCIGEQHMFVAGDVGQSDTIEVIDCSTEADCIRDVAGTSFESLRRRLVERFFEGDILNHVASALPRRHLIQNFGLPVHHADARRCKDLVPREDIEVAIDRLHVDTHGGASQDQRALQRDRQLIENGNGLLRCDNDCLAKGLGPRLDMLHRIFVDALVQDADLSEVRSQRPVCDRPAPWLRCSMSSNIGISPDGKALYLTNYTSLSLQMIQIAAGTR